MKKKQPIGKAILMITQIGISMIVPIFLGVFIGYWLDRWLHTAVFLLIFMIFGILAAFRNVYYLTKPFYAQSLEREKREQAYWASLKAEKTELEEKGHQCTAASEEKQAVGSLLRRERAAEEERRKQKEAMTEGVKSRRQEAEEEFDAWRRRKGQ